MEKRFGFGGVRLVSCAVAAFGLLAPGIAVATEPRCEFPICFPMGNADVVRVFASGDQRLEVVTVGKVSNVTMVLFRMVTASDKAPRWIEAFLVTSNDKKGWTFQPLVANKRPPMRFQFVGDLAKATSVVVQGGDKHIEEVFALDGKATKKLRGVAVVKAMRQQSASDMFEQEIERAAETLSNDTAKLPPSCGAKLATAVSGAKIPPAQHMSIDVNNLDHHCSDIVGAIEAYCQRDPAGPAKFTAAVTTLHCQFVPGGKSSASLDSKTRTLTFNVSLTAPRDGRGSFDPLTFLQKNVK